MAHVFLCVLGVTQGSGHLLDSGGRTNQKRQIWVQLKRFSNLGELQDSFENLKKVPMDLGLRNILTLHMVSEFLKLSVDLPRFTLKSSRYL